MELLLWLVAVVLFVYGVITAVRGDIVLGIVLCVCALLVGPGGVSLFT